MRIVIDTNILFATLLRDNKKEIEIFFSEEIELFACTFLMVELFKHQPKLLKYTKLSDDEIFQKLHLLLRQITFLSENELSASSINEANKLCEGIDTKDILHVALAIELDAKLWSIDKKLKSGLTAKGFRNFFE